MIRILRLFGLFDAGICAHVPRGAFERQLKQMAAAALLRLLKYYIEALMEEYVQPNAHPDDLAGYFVTDDVKIRAEGEWMLFEEGTQEKQAQLLEHWPNKKASDEHASSVLSIIWGTWWQQEAANEVTPDSLMCCLAALPHSVTALLSDLLLSSPWTSG